MSRIPYWTSEFPALAKDHQYVGQDSGLGGRRVGMNPIKAYVSDGISVRALKIVPYTGPTTIVDRIPVMLTRPVIVDINWMGEGFWSYEAAILAPELF